MRELFWRMALFGRPSVGGPQMAQPIFFRPFAIHRATKMTDPGVSKSKNHTKSLKEWKMTTPAGRSFSRNGSFWLIYRRRFLNGPTDLFEAICDQPVKRKGRSRGPKIQEAREILEGMGNGDPGGRKLPRERPFFVGVVLAVRKRPNRFSLDHLRPAIRPNRPIPGPRNTNSR